MFARLAKTSSRQKEIVEVVFRNGWEYMRRLLTGGKTDEPELPTPAILRNILVDLGPVYVKLGQLLSTRPDLLPQDYIDALTDLQANVPPVDWSEVEVTIRQQLRHPLEEVFDKIDPVAIAAGSIAQVHRGKLVDGNEVALKVQRPGIRRIVDRDLDLIRGLAELVARTEFGEYNDPVALADEFAAALRDELNFTKEAHYTDQLRRNLMESRWFEPERLVIPEVHWDLTTEKLLVLEWLDGKPILQAEYRGEGYEGGADAERKDLANFLTQVFFQQIYLDGFFHADPHPGNLFYLPDRRVALLDCGMIGRLDPRTQRILSELLLAMVNQDAFRCAQLTLEMAESAPTTKMAGLENDYDKLLRRYYNLPLSEISFSRVVYELLETARRNRVKLPGNIGLYSKAIANLEGIARSLDPDYNLAAQVEPLLNDLFRRQLIGDSPLQYLLRTALDIKSLSLESPRKIDLFLDRLTSDTMRWNLTLRDLDGLRRSLDDSANRLSFSIVVGSLIVGAAIIFSEEQSKQLFFASSTLFTAASLLGLWLVISILRSGRLRS